MIGDFNEIVTQDEKLRGRPRPNKQMEDFKIAFERNALVDLGWTNPKYTWSNSYKDVTFTKEHLDCVVANNNWLSKFSSPSVDALISKRSDHYSLLLNITDNSERRTRRRIFRCEAKWALKDDGEETI